MFEKIKLIKYTRQVQMQMAALGAPWDPTASRPLVKLIVLGFDQKLSPVESAALIIKVADRLSATPAEDDLDLKSSDLAERAGNANDYNADRVRCLEEEILADIERQIIERNQTD